MAFELFVEEKYVDLSEHIVFGSDFRYNIIESQCIKIFDVKLLMLVFWINEFMLIHKNEFGSMRFLNNSNRKLE